MESIGHVKADGLIPDVLECDQEYTLSIRVKQPVASCDQADYKAAYDRAAAIGRAKLALLKCLPHCGPRVDIEIARNWYCDSANKMLVANVEFLVVCPSKAKKEEWAKQKQKRNLAAPTPDELKHFRSEPQDHFFDQALVQITTDGGHGVLPCPSPELEFTLTYLREVGSCDEYDNDQMKMKPTAPTQEDLGKAAADWARFMAQHSFACLAPCKLRVRTRPLGKGCTAGTAAVLVTVKVACAN
jgi:hypothetical protein